MGLREKILGVFGGDDFMREEPYFRDRHVAFGGTDLDYEWARPAYEYGFVMATDERWRERTFEEAEPGLTERWGEEYARQSGSWEVVRGCVQRAWHRAREVAGLETTETETAEPVTAEAEVAEAETVEQVASEPVPPVPPVPEPEPASASVEAPPAGGDEMPPPDVASRIPSRPES